MQIIVHDDKKLVEVWLTNPEKDDPVIQEKLKPLYQSSKQKKYTVAVFQSGKRSIYDDLRYLAQQHRKRMAENEVQCEKIRSRYTHMGAR